MNTRERLDKMERELADIRSMLQAVAGETGAAAKLVRAGRIVLEDENGTVRARLEVGREGTDLRLFDEHGKPRTVIAAYEAGPAVSLLDERGTARVWLNASADQPAQLVLLDEGGRPRVELGASVARSGLALADERGQPTWKMP